MNKTNNITTPGGTPGKLVNPPSSEAGSMDSGGNHLLLKDDPFIKSRKLVRTPPSQPTRENSMLEANYKKACEERDNFKQLSEKLASEIDKLKLELQLLKDQVNNYNQNEQIPKTVVYSTDEEELRRETEPSCRRTNRNKKRKISMSPELSPPKENQKSPEKVKDRETKPLKPIKPPPIIVLCITKYEGLLNILEENKIKANTALLNSNDVKINVDNEESYRNLTKLLNQKKVQWYSFENKQTRPIKVVAKKLHYSCTPERIAKDLKKKNFKILEVVNMLKHKSKAPLPMFMLTFEQDEDIKKIYEIKDILGMKVQIHPLRKSKLVPQCKNCQKYGHTHKYCSSNPKCVKCAGDHHTKDCIKEKKAVPKCANCSERHPANYRGCIVAKELQQVKDNKQKKMQKPVQIDAIKDREKQNKKDSRPKSRPKINKKLDRDKGNLPLSKNDKLCPIAGPRKTYAHVASTNVAKPVGTPKPPSNVMEDIMQRILNRMEDIEKNNKKILERISFLEKQNSNKRTVPKRS